LEGKMNDMSSEWQFFDFSTGKRTM
jgi:hypothetical protein